jgi:hypothetical protein
MLPTFIFVVALFVGDHNRWYVTKSKYGLVNAPDGAFVHDLFVSVLHRSQFCILCSCSLEFNC